MGLMSGRMIIKFVGLPSLVCCTHVHPPQPPFFLRSTQYPFLLSKSCVVQVFGWAPLQLMLEEEGIYANLCEHGVGPCAEQATKLRTVYTLATSAFCFCVWPTGIILDRFGPRVCCMMGAAFFGGGCALMAISTNEQDYFVHGFVLMAIGGLPVSECLPPHRPRS